jgi:hypothetical protein
MSSKASYWNNSGLYQALSTQLAALIPTEGSVDNPRTTNKCLEKFRKASNCYYDVFNNGLCNRAAEFRQVFGFGGTYIPKTPSYHCDRLEAKMDEIILKAAQEQQLI